MDLIFNASRLYCQTAIRGTARAARGSASAVFYMANCPISGLEDLP